MIKETRSYDVEYTRRMLQKQPAEFIQQMLTYWERVLALYDAEQARRDAGGPVDAKELLDMTSWPIERIMPHLRQHVLDRNHTAYAMNVQVARALLAEKKGGVKV